ncbi:MAG TPA: MFS transporter [Clostridia bacterium]|nr:MFS transporter [Clostridia bacterium]
MRSRWVGIAGILMGMGISAVMQTLLSVSMPSIIKELGGMQLYNWVFGSYMLASSVTIPLFAKMADILGRKAFYMAGLGLFAAGTLLCGAAADMSMLVASRALMGMGAGAITPSAVAMIGDSFKEEEFSKIFGITGVVQVVSNAAGPLLGGFAADMLSWRWGFILFIPLQLVCGLLVYMGMGETETLFKAAPVTEAGALAETRDEIRSEPLSGKAELLKKLDWAGAFLISAGLAGVIVGIQLISLGYIAAGLSLAAPAVLSLFAALRREGRCPMPVLPLKLIRETRLGKIAVLVFLLGIINNSSVTYLSLYYQEVLGRNASAAGIMLLPMLVAAGIGSFECGRVKKRRQNTIVKICWFFLTVAFLAIIPAGRIFNGSLAVAATVPAGFAMGFLLPVFLSWSQRLQDGSYRASSGGLIQLLRNLGGTIGVTLPGIWISGVTSVKTGLSGIFLCLAMTGFSALLLNFRKNSETGTALESD